MSIFNKLIKPKRDAEKPFYGATDTGLRRAYNQDQYFILEKGNIFMVADGMGGHNAGEVASQTAVDVIKEYFNEEILREMEKDQDSIQDHLAKAVLTAHLSILKMGQKEPACHGMGTTMVLCYGRGRDLHIAHVGDSRAYLINDTILQLTQDHSTVAEMVRAGRMKPEEVHDSPLRSQLSQALGAHFPIQPEYNRYILEKGDLVLLCSDGLWDMIEDEEIYETVMKSTSLEVAGQKLIGNANTAGGEDNITVVLYRADIRK